MKLNKPILLRIPATFVQELNNYLIANKPNFKYDIVYFYYIVSYIISEQLRNKNRDEKVQEIPVQINIKSLRSITVYKIGDYIKILKNGEFIIGDNQYIPGEKSRSFIIDEKYLEGTCSVEIKPGSKLFKKVINNQRKKKAHFDRLPPFLKSMADHFMKMDMDYQNAKKWAQDQPDELKRNSYLMAIDQLEDKRFRYFKRNKKNNRLDTNLTNLKSDLRQFIVGDYVSIDLKNSQPFFLSQLLNAIINKDNKQQGTLCCYLHYPCLVRAFGVKRIKTVCKIHQSDEKAYLVNLNFFTYAVSTGTLYDDFVLRYGIIRDDVKKIMFSVLFSKNEILKKFKKFIPFLKEKNVFASIYPIVYQSIKMLKLKDNRLLPVFLQKLESFIFIDCIAKELVNSGIVPLTIHDSVIVPAEQKEKTLEIIKKVFLEQFNVIPSFEVKSLKNYEPELSSMAPGEFDTGMLSGIRNDLLL